MWALCAFLPTWKCLCSSRLSFFGAPDENPNLPFLCTVALITPIESCGILISNLIILQIYPFVYDASKKLHNTMLPTISDIFRTPCVPLARLCRMVAISCDVSSTSAIWTVGFTRAGGVYGSQRMAVDKAVNHELKWIPNSHTTLYFYSLST